MPKLLTTCLFLTRLLFLILISTSTAYADNQSPDPTLKLALQQALSDTSSFDDRYSAEVWLSDMSQRLKGKISDNQKRLKLLKILHQEARRAQLPPELVLAVIEIESNFDRWAISRSGAQGLMQVMPFWLKELDQPNGNLHQVRTNLRMGCTILKYYIDRENGDLRNALARYNGSYGRNRYPDLVFHALNNRWYRQ